ATSGSRAVSAGCHTQPASPVNSENELIQRPLCDVQWSARSKHTSAASWRANPRANPPPALVSIRDSIGGGTAIGRTANITAGRGPRYPASANVNGTRATDATTAGANTSHA